jgi:hypothetical protein
MALSMMSAVANMLDGVRVEIREGIGYQVGFPSQHREIPDQYLPLLSAWFLVTNGAMPRKSKADPLVTVRGAMRKVHLESAISQTMPFVNELMKEGDPDSTLSFLTVSFFDPIDRIRNEALEQEASDMIEAGARAGAKDSIPDLQHATREEWLKITVAEAVRNVKLANTIANRFFGEADRDTAAQARITALFSKFEDDILKQDPNALVLKEMTRLDLPSALLFIKSGLDGVQAIMALSDPEERDKLFKARKNIFGEIARVADMVKVLERFVSAAVALTGAATYTFAAITGNTTLAAQALSSGITRLANVGFVLNIVGTIHGFLVLIDPDASGESKAKATLELGISGLGVAGRFIPALRGVAGPLALSLTVNFYTIKWLAEAAVQMTVDMMRGALTICFKDMKEQAVYVQQTALKLAIARELAIAENDPARAKELTKQAEALKRALQDLIKEYLKRATVRSFFGHTAGRISTFEDRHRDPSAYGPPLIDRFKPLLERKLNTDDEVLSVAVDLIHIIALCFAEAEEILRGVVEDSWKEHG